MGKPLERELEDWVCANIERVAGPGAELVGRQVILPSRQRIDVLAAWDTWAN